MDSNMHVDEWLFCFHFFLSENKLLSCLCLLTRKKGGKVRIWFGGQNNNSNENDRLKEDIYQFW